VLSISVTSSPESVSGIEFEAMTNFRVAPAATVPVSANSLPKASLSLRPDRITCEPEKLPTVTS
jgi:hypothetical protein